MPNYYRGLDSELRRIGDIEPASDDKKEFPLGGDFNEQFIYFPDPSEVALATGIAKGRYDETGGEVGNEEE